MQSKLQLPDHYENAPFDSRNYEIGNKKYIVVRHYVGTKDIDKVLEDLALRQAYSDMKISF